MLKKITTLALFFTCCLMYGQSPRLNLVGSSLSLSKGNINTDVLTDLIQQKQEEVKQRVFRNTIIKNFQKGDYLKDFKNFATYHYIYSIMDLMTTGKSKTALTKSFIKNSADFALIYGVALYNENLEAPSPPFTSENKAIKSLSNSRLFEAATLSYKHQFGLNSGGTIIQNDPSGLNVMVDLCYDVILKEKILKDFSLEVDLSDKNFLEWYKSDNVYLSEKEDSKPEDTLVLFNKRKRITENLQAIVVFQELKKMDGAAIKDKVNYLLDPKNTVTLDKFKEVLTALTKLTPVSDSARINSLLRKVSRDVNQNFENIRQVIIYFSDLNKSHYKDFSITKDQYYAMKYIINEFLKVAKNWSQNDVVARIVDFMIQNTIIQYSEHKTEILKNEEETNAEDDGYLYIDFEAVISSIDQEFSPLVDKGLGIYIQPFVNIGVNYAVFPNTNSLSRDSNGNPLSLTDMTFAGEKIGFKWKIWNWKYTHSFKAGQRFKYFNQFNPLMFWRWNKRKWHPNRYWETPQRKPTVSDLHLIVYGSGLLYNLVDVKSNQNFNYAIAGSSLGLTFYNGLNVSAGVACPYNEKSFDRKNMFMNFSLDIPIVEYLSALRKK